jgi:hypothetical protein
MTEYVIPFLAGGLVVSAFAMLGDILRPKSFAGLFGAAPSVALATLGIAIYHHDANYAAVQTHAMAAGAIGLAVYSVVVCQLPMRTQLRALPATFVVFSRVVDGRFWLAAHSRRTDVMMPVRFSPSALREGRWYEYVIRFVLGGGATVVAGIISSRYGATVGGLFLALPAIFCASATLVEKHEVRRKKEAGLSGERRGQEAAALDAAGAALGAVGLLAFAIVFSLIVEMTIAAAFAAASTTWLIISMTAWWVRKKIRAGLWQS